MGDALAFFDPDEPGKGFTFQGRLSEDFKLSTGTWVRVGPLRQRFLAHFGDLDRRSRDRRPRARRGHRAGLPVDGGMPRPVRTRRRRATVRDVLNADAVRAAFCERLTTFAAEHSGHSTAVVRMILLEQPPSIDGQELTDKGSVNQKQVLANRAELVEQLYGAGAGDPDYCGGGPDPDELLAHTVVARAPRLRDADLAPIRCCPLTYIVSRSFVSLPTLRPRPPADR